MPAISTRWRSTRPIRIRSGAPSCSTGATTAQLQKLTLNFKGWLFDPDFRYLFYAWTTNTNQGLGAQVVLGGFMSYHFSDAVSVAAGIGSLPSTRSTNWTFPNWLKNDNRTMADEYFRASYTSGIWAWGEIAPGLKYRAMVGNNLSQLGVDAAQLDDGFNTVSGALWWLPTTGEYGPAEGFGDFENHQQVATLFGVHYTRSRESAQSQPGTESFENAQIRLSDGTLLFSADPFLTGGRIREATYQMAAANGGFKYRGFSLDGEYYLPLGRRLRHHRPHSRRQPVRSRVPAAGFGHANSPDAAALRFGLEDLRRVRRSVGCRAGDELVSVRSARDPHQRPGALHGPVGGGLQQRALSGRGNRLGVFRPI